MIGSVEQNLDRLHQLGIATDQIEGGLFDLRNRYHSLFHSVDVEKVRSETDGFQSELQEITQGISDVDSQLAQRKIWGGAAVALLLFGGIVSMLLRRTYHDEEGH
jgi:hypothetical protein